MKKFLSRKFLLALISSIVILLNDGLGLKLPSQEISYIAGIVIAYIVGESAIDTFKKK